MFVVLPGRTREEAFRIGAEIAAAVTAANPPPVTLKLEKVRAESRGSGGAGTRSWAGQGLAWHRLACLPAGCPLISCRASHRESRVSVSAPGLLLLRAAQ